MFRPPLTRRPLCARRASSAARKTQCVRFPSSEFCRELARSVCVPLCVSVIVGDIESTPLAIGEGGTACFRHHIIVTEPRPSGRRRNGRKQRASHPSWERGWGLFAIVQGWRRSDLAGDYPQGGRGKPGLVASDGSNRRQPGSWLSNGPVNAADETCDNKPGSVSRAFDQSITLLRTPRDRTSALSRSKSTCGMSPGLIVLEQILRPDIARG